MIPNSFIAAVALAAVHLFAGRLVRLQGNPRSAWLSVAGGMTVTYVFLFLLPHLAEGQRLIRDTADTVPLSFIDHHIYVVSLAGLMVFYGIERIAKRNRGHGAKAHSQQAPRRKVFWAHTSSLFAYNALIGYLLVTEAESTYGLIVFFIAMALHFVVIDFSLREHYPNVYHDIGRWVLSAAVVLGWAAATLYRLPEIVVSLAVAFLAGGIVLNVLKEELPEERQSRFIPFLGGSLAYAALVQGIPQ